MMPRFPNLSQSLAIILVITSMLFAPRTQAATPGQITPTREDTLTHHLVAEYTTVTPGQTLGLIWAVSLDPHWHIYWKNPGDSGLPPELKVGLGSTDALAFPTPKRIDIDPVTNYGYEDRVVFRTNLTLPKDLPTGTFNLPVTLEYLYCSDICLPGTVSYNLPLTVGTTAQTNPAYAPLQEEHAKSLPKEWPATPLQLTYQGTDKLTLNAMAFSSIIPSLQFIPDDEGQIHDNAKQLLDRNVLTLMRDMQVKDQPPLSGLLILNGQGYILPKMTPQATPANNQSGMLDATTAGAPAAFFAVLAGAFFAGLILNLMPCVLPVLALKILGLVKHSTRAQRRSYAAGYTTGILATFGAFALAIVLLQQGGTQLGWGFHLQNPWFVAALTTLMLGLALNFWGVFAIGNRLTRLGSKPTTEKPTFQSALATGALAVIVATPCTVPFMGTAMAYAFTQSWPFTFLTFAALGMGLATPFLILSLVPAATHLLPKPGAWMATFKTLLGWPLLATGLWLAWVFTGQTSPAALFMLLVVLMTFSATLWWYGQRPRLARLLLPLLTLAVGAYILAPMLSEKPTATAWQPWSKQAEESARQTGPVFVDFTADWCITCKVVEATVLDTEAAQTLFRTTGTTIFKADWTKRDDAITAELTAHGRKGVPLYLVYPQGAAQPIILPQLPTLADIETALQTRE